MIWGPDLPRLFLCLLLLVSLAGCSSHKPVVVKPTPLTALDTAPTQIDKRWVRQITLTAKDPLGTAHLPVISSDAVIVCDDKGQVLALSTAKGRSLWQYDSGVSLTGGLTYADGLVVAGGGDGDVLALTAADGQLRWRNRVSSEVLTSPLISDGIVIVRSVDGRIVAFDSVDGKRLWTYQLAVPSLSLHGLGRPLVEAGVVFAGFADGRLVALDLHDGRELWQLAVTVPQGRSELERLADVDANLVQTDGVVFAAAYRGRVVAVNEKDGRLLWARDLSVYRGLAVDDAALYLVDDEDAVWAISRRNGATLWKQEGLLHRSLTAPVLIDGRLVVGDVQGYLHWLDVRDGSFAGRTRLGDNPISQLQQDDQGALYVVSSDGRLTRLLAHLPDSAM
jgi:outer membrane protein assembly factor BamB